METLATKPALKVLNYPNLGNRFLSDHFLLITPEMPAVPGDELTKRFLIHDTLNTVPDFEAERVMIGRAELWKFSDLFTWLCGAADPKSFYEDFLNQFPECSANKNVTLVVLKRVVPVNMKLAHYTEKVNAA